MLKMLVLLLVIQKSFFTKLKSPNELRVLAINTESTLNRQKETKQLNNLKNNTQSTSDFQKEIKDSKDLENNARTNEGQKESRAKYYLARDPWPADIAALIKTGSKRKVLPNQVLELTEESSNLGRKEHTLEVKISSDVESSKILEGTELKHEMEKVCLNETLNIPSPDISTKKNNTSEKETQKLKSPGKKSFESNPLVFIIGLMMGSISNLFTSMVRIYKRSIPEFKLNMVVLLNYYCVEVVNLVLCIQIGGVMFASVISHIHLTAALAINLALDFAGSMGIGLAMMVAVVRLLFVIQFDLMNGLDPVPTTRTIVGCMMIFYLILQLALFPIQLSTGHISPISSFMSGEPATLAINRYSVEHAVHILIVLIVTTFSYFYIKHYIKTNHSAATANAEFSPSKSMFTIKGVLVGCALASIFLLTVVFLPKSKHSFPTGVFLSSIFMILIEYNFARKNVIKSYFKLQVRKCLTKHFTFIKPYEGSQVGNAPPDEFQREDSVEIHGVNISQKNFTQNAGSRTNNSVAVLENRPRIQADSEDSSNELPVTYADIVLNERPHDQNSRKDSNITSPIENFTNRTLDSASREDTNICPIDSASRKDSPNSPVDFASRKDSTNSPVDSASREDSTTSSVDSPTREDYFSLTKVSNSREDFNYHPLKEDSNNWPMDFAAREDANNHSAISASREDSNNHNVDFNSREIFTKHSLAFDSKEDSTDHPLNSALKENSTDHLLVPFARKESIQPSLADPQRKYSNKMPEVDI